MNDEQSEGTIMKDWMDTDDEDEFSDDETVASGDDEEEDGDSDAAIEATFREERAAVRASIDLPDLRRVRRNLQDALADDSLAGVAAARARDLVELIDDRIAELRARQLTGRAR